MIIYNSKLAKLIIPNHKMITIGPIVLCKKNKESYKQEDLIHESFHVEQWLACFVFGFIISIFFGNFWLKMIFSLTLFYIWYGVEFLIKLFLWRNKKIENDTLFHYTYKNVSFEREAYENEDDPDNQFPFSFVKYI